MVKKCFCQLILDVIVNIKIFGYADDMKAYKANPEAFRGNVADVSMFLRVAVTGKLNSPDMYAVMQVMGKDRVAARIGAMIASL